ncbi:MAG: hypothetical protein HY820_07895 [Acidobacteria bacterium]|nr:hypothetical protein [Acidobacteriota bacterium]
MLFALLGPLTLLSTAGAQTLDPHQIMKRAVSHDQSNWEKSKNYTYISRATVREKDSKGNIRKTEQEAHEVLILFGQSYEKLIEKDGKQLTGDKLRKEQEKLDKLVAKRQKESEAERNKRLAGHEKDRRRQREFAQEIPNAYNFRLLGEEAVGGRPAWMIEATPREGFHSSVPRANILKKFRGRLWVDKSEYQLVRIDAEAIDTVSFGLVLARIGKGTKFFLEQTRVNDEVWMPKTVQVTLDARLGLIKKLQGDVDVRFDSFRKFQSESKIVSTAETQQ